MFSTDCIRQNEDETIFIFISEKNGEQGDLRDALYIYAKVESIVHRYYVLYEGSIIRYQGFFDNLLKPCTIIPAQLFEYDNKYFPVIMGSPITMPGAILPNKKREEENFCRIMCAKRFIRTEDGVVSYSIDNTIPYINDATYLIDTVNILV